MNNISLIVPVYKNPVITKTCIESITASLSELEDYHVELIVINDSPADEPTNELLISLCLSYPCIKVITNEFNLGFVKSVNKGLLYSSRLNADVILINSDTITYPNTLLEILNVAYSDPMIGFCSPRSNNASICSLPHFYGGVPSSPEIAYERWKSIKDYLPRFHYTPTAVGFYLFIRHEVIANFGHLDETFGVGYEEENDLIMRANKVGYRSVLANHAYAYHAGSASFKLTPISLDQHRLNNNEIINKRHPEFIPLVNRYVNSPLYEAESNLSPYCSYRLTVVIDLTQMGNHHNGTNQMALAILDILNEYYSDTLDIEYICEDITYNYHNFSRFKNLKRGDGITSRQKCIAIRFCQPFNAHHLENISCRSLVNIYAMLDTIALDCGHLAIQQEHNQIWEHVAEHSNGIIYISEFSKKQFHLRYPQSTHKPSYTRILPTAIDDYDNIRIAETDDSHILIIGNHYPHKDSDNTAMLIAQRYPTLKVISIGGIEGLFANLISYRSGTLTDNKINHLYDNSSIIVLPSYYEGFGFGLINALSRKKVVVARDIPATREILDQYPIKKGVYLYKDNTKLFETLDEAFSCKHSQIQNPPNSSWKNWVDGLVEFLHALSKDPDIYINAVKRIDDLNKIKSSGHLNEKNKSTIPTPITSLLKLHGTDFIHACYTNLLNRNPDPSGLSHYMAMLKMGKSRITIFFNILFSKESLKRLRTIA